MSRRRDDFDRLRHEEGQTSTWRLRTSGWETADEGECDEPFFEPPTEKSSEESEDWTSALTKALGKLATIVEERRRSKEQIDSVVTRLEAVESKVETLEKAGALVVPVNSFAPEPFDLLKEIKVVVEKVEEDEYLATFFDAGISASGCNPQEAVDGLKELIASRFDYLNNLPPERMGPIPARQIAALREFLRKRG